VNFCLTAAISFVVGASGLEDTGVMVGCVP
jgi:hypothetical protein